MRNQINGVMSPAEGVRINGLLTGMQKISMISTKLPESGAWPAFRIQHTKAISRLFNRSALQFSRLKRRREHEAVIAGFGCGLGVERCCFCRLSCWDKV